MFRFQTTSNIHKNSFKNTPGLPPQNRRVYYCLKCLVNIFICLCTGFEIQHPMLCSIFSCLQITYFTTAIDLVTENNECQDHLVSQSNLFPTRIFGRASTHILSISKYHVCLIVSKELLSV